MAQRYTVHCNLETVSTAIIRGWLDLVSLLKEAVKHNKVASWPPVDDNFDDDKLPM